MEERAMAKVSLVNRFVVDSAPKLTDVLLGKQKI